MNDINSISWADASLDSIEINYETILLKITMYNDSEMEILCVNHIGISYLGHWDENIIHNISVSSSSDLIEKSLKIIKNNYGKNPLKGGGIKIFDSNWIQVNVKLIDGVVIEIICNEIVINRSKQINS